MEQRLTTKLVHVGTMASAFGGAHVTPIVRSTVFESREGERHDEIRYGRLGTLAGQVEAAAVLAAIEEGEVGLIVGSGMAAITTCLLSVLAPGGHLLVQRPLYGGTQHFVTELLPQLGGSVTAIDVQRPESWAQHLQPNTRAIYVESISNPVLEIAPHAEVVAFAKAHGLVSVIDNTFASPVNFRPLAIGFDVVLHSATKYLNGHSDVCAGAVVGSRERIAKVKAWLSVLGGAADPEACFLLRRGLRTLSLRVERQNQNALALAAFLEQHPAVARVRYPGLASHPSHGLASDLFSGGGGMIACELRRGAEEARRFAHALRVAVRSASLGGTETLVTIPAQTSHATLRADERAACGITDGLIRISTGIEDIEDLIADFDRALAA